MQLLALVTVYCAAGWPHRGKWALCGESGGIKTADAGDEEKHTGTRWRTSRGVVRMREERRLWRQQDVHRALCRGLLTGVSRIRRTVVLVLEFWVVFTTVSPRRGEKISLPVPVVVMVEAVESSVWDDLFYKG